MTDEEACEVVIGTVFSSASSDYEVQGILGSGTFGEVTQCRKVATNQTVALKIINRQICLEEAKDEEEIHRRMKELDSENFNIVIWNDAFTFQGRFFLEFEKLDISLYDLLQRDNSRTLELMAIRPILQQLAKALGFLKSIGIVHADLKPENIMMVDHIRQPMRVKVIDFGLACNYPEQWTGVTIQTLWYRAPEILLGASFNQAVDIWSLGCIAVELLRGNALFPGEDEYDMMRHIVHSIGMPADHILNGGMYTQKYFIADNTCFQPTQWRFMSATEAGNFTCSRCRIITLADLEKCRTLTGEDACADECDLASFVDLLSKTLDLESSERITPSQILRHSFITMSHLVGTFDNSYHVEKSMNVMKIFKDLSSDDGYKVEQATVKTSVINEMADSSTSSTSKVKPPSPAYSGPEELQPTTQAYSGPEEVQPTTPAYSGPEEVQPTTPAYSGPEEVQSTTSAYSGPEEVQPTTPAYSGPEKVQPTTPAYSGPEEVQPTTPAYSGPEEVQSTTPAYSGPEEVQPTTPAYSGPEEVQSTTPAYSGPEKVQPTTPAYSGPEEVQPTTPAYSGPEEAQPTTPVYSGPEEVQPTTPAYSGSPEKVQPTTPAYSGPEEVQPTTPAYSGPEEVQPTTPAYSGPEKVRPPTSADSGPPEKVQPTTPADSGPEKVRPPTPAYNGPEEVQSTTPAYSGPEEVRPPTQAYIGPTKVQHASAAYSDPCEAHPTNPVYRGHYEVQPTRVADSGLYIVQPPSLYDVQPSSATYSGPHEDHPTTPYYNGFCMGQTPILTYSCPYEVQPTSSAYSGLCEVHSPRLADSVLCMAPNLGPAHGGPCEVKTPSPTYSGLYEVHHPSLVNSGPYVVKSPRAAYSDISLFQHPSMPYSSPYECQPPRPAYSVLHVVQPANPAYSGPYEVYSNSGLHEVHPTCSANSGPCKSQPANPVNSVTFDVRPTSSTGIDDLKHSNRTPHITTTTKSRDECRDADLTENGGQTSPYDSPQQKRSRGVTGSCSNLDSNSPEKEMRYECLDSKKDDEDIWATVGGNFQTKKVRNECLDVEQIWECGPTSTQKLQPQKRKRVDTDHCSTTDEMSPAKKRRSVNLSKELSDSVKQLLRNTEEAWSGGSQVDHLKKRKRFSGNISSSRKDKHTPAKRRRNGSLDRGEL